jgi:SAM-dependent methyltransferase
MTDAAPAPPPDPGHRWFAAIYDRMMRMGERRLGPMRARLIAEIEGDVLEVGAGTGANFPHYAPSARVVALEPDPFMLERARPRAEAAATVIELRQAPAESLPFPDASFDAVVSTLVLCTVRDVPRALAEIRRVLRPGGRLVFIEHVRGDGVLGRVHDLIQPIWGWCSAGCNVNRRTEPALAANGFDIESVKHIKMAPWMPAIIGTATPTAAAP